MLGLADNEAAIYRMRTARLEMVTGVREHDILF